MILYPSPKYVEQMSHNVCALYKAVMPFLLLTPLVPYLYLIIDVLALVFNDVLIVLVMILVQY